MPAGGNVSWGAKDSSLFYFSRLVRNEGQPCGEGQTIEQYSFETVSLEKPTGVEFHSPAKGKAYLFIHHHETILCCQGS
jgi:hypothetical protein